MKRGVSMKSLQSKIITLVLACAIVATLIPLGVGIYNAEKTLDEDSEEILNLLCTNEVNQLDETIRNIEESVDTLYQFSLAWLPKNNQLFKNQSLLNEYMSKMEEASINVVEHTEGAISVFFRLNPDYTNSVAGFFLIEDGKGGFKEQPPTDLNAFSKEDIDRVGWYYAPLEAGEAVWMDPYLNGIIERELISYIVPVYDGNIVVGVLGMDVDLELLRKNIRTITLYESGFAVLLDSKGNLIYHKDYPEGVKIDNFDDSLKELSELVIKAQETGKVYSYQWNNVEKRMLSKSLANDMIFAITVPEREIQKPMWDLLLESILLGGLVIVVATFVSIRMSQKLTQPLKQLNIAAKKIATGDMDVTIECDSKDEVGMLAENFKKTANALNGYMKYMNKLAFKDSLTKVGNKTAYDEVVSIIEGDIAVGVAAFGIVVMDVNNLKYANDTYGHEVGNMLLLDAATTMRRVFGSDSVYRIGGDEFAVILQGDRIAEMEKLSEKFETEISNFNESDEKNYEMKLQVAIGFTEFKKDEDLFYTDVFKRADKLMYLKKKIQKGEVSK